MEQPRASRPFMPGYGLRDADQGTGLLPWSWAEARLQRSHDYWVATSDPSGAPHMMPVWGVWLDDGLWFSSSRGSRKARNIAARARCSIATDDANEPVIVEGDGEIVDDLDAIQRFVGAINEKYATDYGIDFFAGRANACFRVRPVWAFGLLESDFTGSPTRWEFPSHR